MSGRPGILHQHRREGRNVGRKKTTKWQEPFLKEFAETLNMGAACDKAKTSRWTVRRRRESDEEFDGLYLEAEQTAVDALEGKLYEIGIGGDVKAIVTLLKAHRPNQYRERREVLSGQSPDAGPVRKEVTFEFDTPEFVDREDGE